MVDATSLGFAFATGLFLLLSPCGIPMLPAYLAYYLGASRVEAPAAAPRRATFWLKSAARGASGGLLVSAGAMVVLALVGAVGYYASSVARERFVDLELVGGVIVIAMGVWLLLGRDLSIAIPVRASGEPGILGLLGFGALYAVASAGCSFGLFLGFVITAAAQPAVDAAVLFASFASGFSLLLVGLSVAVATARAGIVGFVRGLVPLVKRLAGGVMVLMGAYMIYYWWTILRLGG